MSQQLVNNYLNDLDRYKKISGSLTEGVISEAFKDLLKAWARQSNLHFINQYEFVSAQKNRIRPDGTILHDLRVPLGYWEAKDSNDDLEAEIAKKLAKGYPQDNIIFEDSANAVLIQNRHEIMRCDMTDTAKLLRLLNLFFGYERAEIAEFRKAVEQFKADLPAVLEALREKIDAAYAENPEFQQAAKKFLAHAKDTINPSVTEADVREMLIQHILTEEIFDHVFNDNTFHRENNIAKELYALEAKFFTGAVKRNTLKALETYYAAIRANAAAISSHSEKQGFLKVIYENFYKIYNPKAADRLGVVYTPNEIVKFMIEGADWLCEKHFGKNLIDRDVEILDPATGTGTFICELLESFRGQKDKLLHKYKNELHANEVAILPYYVANLNIEATYAAISGQFAEFPNLCFVDTLDNVAGLGIRLGQHVGDFFGALSEENVARVKRQNRRKISVILGNPPYNVGQLNESNKNKNREYPHIDNLIRQSYVKLSAAQKSAVYDMYSRFIRWASDRLHDDGVLAFITNRSFIDSRTYDGFRKTVVNEFSEIHLVDLGGDVRANPKLSGTTHNVFGIQTGVTISFFVKRHRSKDCKIYYSRRPEMETKEDKLSFLASHKLSSFSQTQLKPDPNGNWINQEQNNWSDFIAIADKATKASKKLTQEKAIFKLFATGVMSGRDEWVYDFSEEVLENKIRYFFNTLNEAIHDKVTDISELSERIKISSSLRLPAKAQRFKREFISLMQNRAFVSSYIYGDPTICDRLTENHNKFFGENLQRRNKTINFRCVAADDGLSVLSTDALIDYSFVKTGNGGTSSVALHRFAEDGTRVDNITDWGLKQFQTQYEKGEKKPKRRMSKDDIFAYVYGVLHDPVYREKYAINLKREFPRIPFYPDFWAWAEWGTRLMELHIGYETVKPWPLKRHDEPPSDADPIPKLKAEKDNGIITLDSRTTLSGIPATAWDHRLGNRSGLEWVLDQYKEKKPKDPTIAAKFNTYRFKDYKEKVIDLLARVTRVSVETMEIVDAMKSTKR